MPKTPELPPLDYLKLRDVIAERHQTLSKRLKQIAQFALDHPTEMAIETIAVIAKEAGVQPSAIIRFAKAFGYTGFTEMQRCFQEHVVRRSGNYKERVRTIMDTTELPNSWSSKALLEKFCETTSLSLESLRENIDRKDLDKATRHLQKADRIFIVGQRRSYPVATYLAYMLSHSQNNAFLLDGQGGMLNEQANTMRKSDVLIAITFNPPADETRNVVINAAKKGADIILITDSSLNPITNKASVCFFVHDAELLSFRSLAATMCLVQTLATNLVLRGQ